MVALRNSNRKGDTMSRHGGVEDFDQYTLTEPDYYMEDPCDNCEFGQLRVYSCPIDCKTARIIIRCIQNEMFQIQWEQGFQSDC